MTLAQFFKLKIPDSYNNDNSLFMHFSLSIRSWDAEFDEFTTLEDFLLLVKKYLNLPNNKNLTKINLLDYSRVNEFGIWNQESIGELIFILENSNFGSIEEFIFSEIDINFNFKKHS